MESGERIRRVPEIVQKMPLQDQMQMTGMLIRMDGLQIAIVILLRHINAVRHLILGKN